MKLLFILGIAFVFSVNAEARKNSASPTPPPCDAPIKASAAKVNVPKYTYYKPGLGGINGSCNGGALAHRGFLACRNTLDKFVGGKSPYIHVAAQQKGGSANLFGCWARTDGFKKRGISAGPNSCHILAVADHYAKSENAGRVGIGGTVNGTKMDVEVDSKSKYTSKIVKSVNSTTACVARLVGVQNRDNPNGSFKIKRKRGIQAAVDPVEPLRAPASLKKKRKKKLLMLKKQSHNFYEWKMPESLVSKRS